MNEVKMETDENFAVGGTQATNGSVLTILGNPPLRPPNGLNIFRDCKPRLTAEPTQPSQVVVSPDKQIVNLLQFHFTSFPCSQSMELLQLIELLLFKDPNSELKSPAEPVKAEPPKTPADRKIPVTRRSSQELRDPSLYIAQHPVLVSMLTPPENAKTSSPRESSGPSSETPRSLMHNRPSLYGAVECVICGEMVCSRSRKIHIEAHLNYRPFHCTSCSFRSRKEILLKQHIQTAHQGRAAVRRVEDEEVLNEVKRLCQMCLEPPSVRINREIVDSKFEYRVKVNNVRRSYRDPDYKKQH